MMAEWAALTPKERWMIFFVACFIVAVWIAFGIALGRTLPVKETVEQEVITVQRIEQRVVPVPSDRVYPPLDDPAKACTGAPVVIVKLVVEEREGGGWSSFFTVRPAGDDYLVSCYMAGAMSELMSEGDLVALPKGELAG